jgi:hypothetical protein
MKSGTPTITYDLATLSRAWSIAGRGLRRPAASSCVVGGCRSLAFVDLHTNTGSRAICFKHYGLLEQADTQGE